MGKQGKSYLYLFTIMSIHSELIQYGNHIQNRAIKFNISTIIIKYNKVMLYSNRKL